MAKLEVSFEIDSKKVDSVNIKSLSFTQYANIVTGAHALKNPSTFEGRMRRLRMEQQVDYFMNGTAVHLGMDEILKMPLIAARKISNNLEQAVDSSIGKIIRDGDGVSTAIAYELGTPIPTGQGKEPIRELEFLAKTYGDIEDVLAASDAYSQTVALLRTVAKPVHPSLQSMPSWAVEQVSLADGVTIAQTVTTRFLDDEQEDN